MGRRISMSVQSWAKRLASYETGLGPWYRSGWTELFMLRVEQIADQDVSLHPSSWNRIASTASYEGGRILWDVSLPLADRLRFLDALRRLALKVARYAPERSGLRRFWIRVVEGSLVAEDRFGGPSSGKPLILERLYGILTDQARQPDRHLQESALYGLKALQDSRTPDFVASLRAHFSNEDVRQLAEDLARRSHR
jgi:hypothetical protein